ncbi:unnamed protein product [Mytilus edulis]|uniref:Uncharacterized protein n=1 Tax=Mytilus edulis TaxID=6550 RepID=A0A8S3UR81_MYTED|nr:unnamed protein product [Mytilus edulis]
MCCSQQRKVTKGPKTTTTTELFKSDIQSGLLVEDFFHLKNAEHYLSVGDAGKLDVQEYMKEDRTGGSALIGTLNALLGLTDTFFGCVAGFLGPAGSVVSTLYTAARCLVDVHYNCDNGGRRRRDVSSEVVNNLLDSAKPVDNFLSMMQQILNDENIWNNTATAWKDGTLNTLDGTEDIINLKNLNSGIQQYINDFKSAKTKGFDTIFDVFDHATKTYKTAEQEAKSGSSGGSSEFVCAKVRVRIVQELVLTRDAFNARLR